MTGTRGKEMIVQRRMLFAVAVALVAIAGAAAVGTYAYRAGVAHGIEDAARAPGAEGVAPYAYHPHWHPGPYGFGFGGILFPLLFVFLLFAFVRRAFWGWGYRGHGPWGRGGPGRLEEWHRQMHESMQRNEQKV
jgi:hypothetical protein